MSSGGKKFSAMHTAHRYRPIPCASCGAEFLAYGQRKICDDCKAAKAKTPEAVQKLAAQRAAAQRAAAKAIREGLLIRQPCVICTACAVNDGQKAHGHHEDYSKPLEVIWLCSFHHIKRHEELRHSPSILSGAELVERMLRKHREYRQRNPHHKVRPIPGDHDYVAPEQSQAA